MTLKEVPEILAKWADDWGRDPLLVQGPGANLSAKDGDLMWIKASGSRLDHKSEKRWTLVNWKACQKALPVPNPAPVPVPAPGAQAEAKYFDLVKDAALKPHMPRPSMELGMHSVLPHKYVVHLHSLATILLAAIDKTNPLFCELTKPIKDHGFAIHQIPAMRPGLALTWAISRQVNPASVVYLLANHGVVWASDCEKTLAGALDSFEIAAANSLNFALFPYPNVVTQSDLLTCDFQSWPQFHWHVAPLFPDFAVFFPDPGNQPSLTNRVISVQTSMAHRDASELIFAQALVGTVAKIIDAEVVLPEEIASYVANMKLEQLRRAKNFGGS